MTKKKAEQGNAAAQNSLGWRYKIGDGTDKGLKNAFDWFKKAAEQGDVMGQMMLGGMYLKGIGTQKDLNKSARWIKILSESKDPEAKEFAEEFWNEYELLKHAE